MNIEERNRLVIALSKIQIPPTPSRQEVIGTMLADEIVCFLESFGWLSPEQVKKHDQRLLKGIENEFPIVDALVKDWWESIKGETERGK